MATQRIPEEFIDEILAKVDLVDVVSEHVTLRRSGRRLVGLCPFHAERTPSFSVSPDKQFFYCFGCGAGGTSLQFVQRLENLSFVEAIQELAKRAQVALPMMADSDTSHDDTRKELLRAHDLAAKYYNYILMNSGVGEKALRYLEGRGIQRTTVQEFGIGYAPAAPETLVDFLRKRGFSDEIIVESGLGNQRDNGRVYDRFRDRVMIPIHDGQGRVVAFGGRTLGKGEPKYLNSPETPLFRKGRTLFNLHRSRPEIRRAGLALIFEGYMDVITAYQYGIAGTVAALGTSLTPEQAGIIKRNAEEVVMIYDGDRAGQRAAERNGEIALEAELRVRLVNLPEGHDPDDLLRTYGRAEFDRLVHEAVSLPRFALLTLRSTADTSTADARLRLIQESLVVVARYTKSPIEREALLRELSKEFGVSYETLERELELVSKIHGVGDKAERKWDTVRDIDSIRNKGVTSVALSPHMEAERKLLTYMLIDAGVTKQVQVRLRDEFLADEHRALAAHLYRFYDMDARSDPTAFLLWLDDERLRQVVSEMMVSADDAVPPTDMVEESIRRIELFIAHREYEQIEREMIDCGNRGDFEGMARAKERREQKRAQLDMMRRG